MKGNKFSKEKHLYKFSQIIAHKNAENYVQLYMIISL